MNSPKVSVLMPVYNGEKYVAEAIQSILDQTFQDFELIIVDDGSTDRTSDIISAMSDERVRILTNTENLGIVASLNKGVASCRGKYIARMDADDIALPSRLGRQVTFLEKFPSIAICGTYMTVINEHGIPLRVITQQIDHIRIKFTALFFCPLFHPTIMAKREVLQGNSYDERFRHAEDYELWCRLLRQDKYRFANMSETLLKYRTHGSSIGSSHSVVQRQISSDIRHMQLKQYLSDLEIQMVLTLRPSLAFMRVLEYVWVYNKLALSFHKKESQATPQVVWTLYFCNTRLIRELLKRLKQIVLP